MNGISESCIIILMQTKELYVNEYYYTVMSTVSLMFSNVI